MKYFNPEALELGELLKTDSREPVSTVHVGEYEGESAIVKQGGRSVSNEIVVLEKVNTTGIPHVIASKIGDDASVLVMERMPGIGLDALINLTPSWTSDVQPKETAVAVVDGLAQRMDSLHDAGFLYRDLSLKHVLISEKGVSLIDHEWDVYCKTSALVSSIAGTWETMAPEEFTPGNTMTQASSVYTLGVVLMQLTLGKNPFYIEPAIEPNVESRRHMTLGRHMTFDTSALASKGLGKVLRNALQPKQNDRPATLQDFRKQLLQAAKK